MSHGFRITCVALGALSVGACGWLLPDGVLEDSSDAGGPDATITPSDAPLGVDGGNDGSGADGSVDVDFGPCTDEPFTALAPVRFGTDTAAGPLTFSRDELQAFYVFEGTLYRRDRATRTAAFTGEGVPITSGSVLFAMVDVSVSSDGKVLYAASSEGSIYARPLNNGVATGDWRAVMAADAGSVKGSSSSFRLPFATGSSVWATATPAGGGVHVVRTTLSGGTYSPLETVMTGDDFDFFVIAEDPTVAFIGYGTPAFVHRAVPDAGGLYSIGAAVTPFDAVNITEVPRWLSPDGCRLYIHVSVPGIDGGANEQKMFVASRTRKDAGP